MLFDAGKSDLRWGPKGSGFAVVRCLGAKGDAHFIAVDLRTGMTLREGFSS